MKTKYTIFLFLMALVVSCKDAFEDQTFTAYEETPMATYLKNHPEQFGLWVEVLEKADLFNTLNLNTTYTLFAPINEGVEAYLKRMNLSTVAEMDAEDAAYLVRYHLIPGFRIDRGQFEAGAINNLTATDDNLFVEFRDGGLEAVYLNGEARFNAFNIETTNGLIHGIDDVLTPLTVTVADQLDAPRFSIFKEAVAATGYLERLGVVYTDDVDANGEPIQRRYKFTAFAVSDEMYANAGIESLADLAAKVGATGSDYTDPENELNRYVGYHLMDQQRSYADLGQFPEGAEQMNIATMATNALLKVSEGNDGLIINEDTDAGTFVPFVETNIACKNGVVHEVGDWMPLFVPEQVQVIWEFTDYADIEANVEQYRNPSLGAQYNKSFVPTDLTSITWLSYPSERPNAVVYRNNRDVDGAQYSTLNHDHLRVELGESGWIQMESPTIVKGKYKVSLSWPSPRNASNTGICSFILDGMMLNPRVVLSNTSLEEIKTMELGEVDFPETTTHTLRILSLDGRLLPLDYLQFDPVE